MSICKLKLARAFPGRLSRIMHGLQRYKYLYLMFIPVLVYYIVFCYAPMINPQTGGILMAFKQHHLTKPFSEWEWVGLKYFEMMWRKPDFWIAFRNTITISFARLIFEFPVPILLAFILNEVASTKFRRFCQTVFTFPNFLSWVLVIGLLRDLLQVEGLVNGIITSLGGRPYQFLANSSVFSNYALLILTNLFKNVGWASIIYLAAIASIDPTLYEAAKVDGANRWQCIRYVTWPGIKSTTVVLLILQCGNILNGNFDQIFNLVNGVNRDVIEILDVYIYRYAFQQSINQSFAAASGLFKAVISFSLLIAANQIARALGEERLF
ncbi:MAG: ABC transporter permease subunit [Anaerolineae bacterium]|nr:ABC transporter permease subunit [Candidatus Roseilinea sp.]MDW8450611.1 ABC transporter permease subunit [Anaerolineae bacterium]